MRTTTNRRLTTNLAWARILVLTVLGMLLAACGGGGASSGHSKAPAGPATASLAVPPAAGPQAPASAAAAATDYKLLKTSPESGFVGASFTITGEALPANKPVSFVWVTVDGSYAMNVLPDTVQYNDRTFVERRVVLAPSSGSAVVDGEGHLSASFVAPDDYGGIHDIYAVIDGQQVGKAGYAVLRHVTISPTSGPVGEPISISIDGLGWKPWESALAVLWDNKYTGFLAATTTRGTITVVIRAAGPVGKRSMRVKAGGTAVPYLNIEQSPVAQFPDYNFTFTVTADRGAPSNTLEWPDDSRVVVNPASKTTVSADASLRPGISATLTPSSGPVTSTATLQATGLPAESSVDLAWATEVGSRMTPNGWSVKELPLGQASTSKDGSLQTTVQIPDDLGGWHALRVLQGGKEIAEAPYYVEESLVSVTPAKVKTGDVFTVHIKGVGWTELDNAMTVVYDNAYMGYACGFNSQGDITLPMVATGGPGTHLIDMYPMLYEGSGKPPWNYELPMLSFKQDAPGLSLGYRLPAYRLAIEVVR